MKKITIYILSILIGLFCLGGGAFLFTSDMNVPQQEEVAEPEYTITFKRSSSCAYSGSIYVANCTTGTYSTMARPSSGYSSYSLTYSASDVLRISIPRGVSYNYEFITDGYIGGEGASTFTFVNEVFFLGSNLTSYSQVLYYATGKYANYTVTYNSNGGTFIYGGDGQSATGNNRRYATGAFVKLGDRTYYKKNSGYAYIGWAHRLHRWTWPVLVATSSSAVQYYSSYNTSATVGSAGSFTYNNSTYYYSGMGYEYQSQFNSLSATTATAPYIDTHELLYPGNCYGSSFDLHKLIAQKTVEYGATRAVLWSSGSSYVFPKYSESSTSSGRTTPYREGYTFKGWYTSSSGGTQITSSSSISANKTLYAQWTENTYYLEFVHPESDFSYSTTKTVKYTGSTTIPGGYTDMGYHLDYWDDDYCYYTWYPGDSISGEQLASEFGLSNGNTLYFYGVQSPNIYYLEFYDDSGGSDGPVAQVTRTWEQTCTMPVEVNPSIYRWGYYLEAWATYDWGPYAAAGDTIYISDLAYDHSLEYDNEAYISFYSVWEEDPKVSVSASKSTGISSASFKADYDGVSSYISGSTSNTGVYEGSSVTFTASVASGFSFDGWYSGSTRVSTSTTYTTTVGTSDMSLTAKATAVPATVYMKLALAGGATWPSGVSASAQLNYTNTSGTSTYATISASSATTTSVLSTKSVTVSNISFSDTKLAYVDYWVDTSGYNTNHSTGYHPSTSGFTVASSASGTYYVTLVFAYCNNSALLKYDSTNKYFYFEDGQYPQTYVGSSMNTTLNNWYTSNSATYSMYINGKSVSVYNYSGTKYARIQAPKASTVTISTGSTTFSSGTYYWFRLDPIRWRVSNYGVGSTAYPTMVKNRGVVASNQKVVSDLVLDWTPIYTSTTPEGWSYKNSSTIHSQIYSTNNTNLTNQSAFAYKGTGTYSFDAYSNSGTTVKVTSSTSSMSGILQVSTDEISLNTSDIRAKASDLVCMLAGVSSGYCDYWTRDLTTLNNGLYVTSTGITRNRWLTSACGVRLAYTLSSVARTRD